MEDIHLDECVSCGSGLLAVSDICPQCGWPKNKIIHNDESEEKIKDNIEDDPPTPEPVVIKNKIFRPTSVRLLGLFHMFFGISMIVFALIAGLGVLLLVMSSGISALGDIGGGSMGGMGDMMMIPGMDGIDQSTMSFFITFIELNEITGSPSVTEIEQRLNFTGMMNMDAMIEFIGNVIVIALIEIALGVFAVMLGLGLFKGQKWARPVTIGYSIFSIPILVLFIENIDNLILLGMAAFDGMLLYCMFKSKVKEYFNQPSMKKPNKKSKIKNSRTVKKSQK